MVENNQKQDLEQFVLNDYKQKVELKNKELNYYTEKMKELGLKSIDRFVKYHPNPSKYMKLSITYAHRDLEIIAKVMVTGKPWAVVSGLNPSGPLHFGHKCIFDELLWLQRQGADVFIPITNDESYVVNKTNSLAESRRIAYDYVIPSIIAMGFDAQKTHIFVDSDYPDIYNVAMDLSRKLTLNKVNGVFGFDGSDNPGTLFYRAAVQIAQILLPQYEEFGGPKPTLIPVGIDQHPYILLARDVAEKKENFIPPAAIYLKFLMGLDGKGKMSASRDGSAIFLTDDQNKSSKYIRSSYTGGSPLAEFQKIHGGIPDICPVYGLRTYNFEPDNRVYDECSSGKVLCGECKKRAITPIHEYLKEHQSKLEEARQKMDQYLLRTPIRSIFK